jgi:hypothetical protein
MTTTFPVVVPVGTVTTIEVASHSVGVAAVPLNATVLSACVEPKFVPVMVTDAPTAPEFGDKFVTLGVAKAATQDARSIPTMTSSRRPNSTMMFLNLTGAAFAPRELSPDRYRFYISSW